ncbi:TRK system potassium uptake protein [Babesia gibsoni]|uniref:TRK system potassium uptake protein n=1 Tax=Babesia gibsoni TaxID=33632 RepID=A0AAD8UV76_BABGI|nr:TRK system potassium uptake protein [Babesia gibsoni]
MPPRKVDTGVLVVGAGPVGVTLQLLLGRLGIPSLLAERNTMPRSHPRAHYISNRSMEVWRQVGHLDMGIDCITEPLDFWRFFKYCRHITDPHINTYGVVDHFKDTYNYGGTYFEELSPSRITNIPQHKLLFILKTIALSRSQIYGGQSDPNYVSWLKQHYMRVLRNSSFEESMIKKLANLDHAVMLPTNVEPMTPDELQKDVITNVPFIDGGLRFEGFVNDDFSNGVVSELTSTRDNTKVHIKSAFVVGADGIHSKIRKVIDGRNRNAEPDVCDTALLKDVMSVYFSSSHLGELVASNPAMIYFIFSRCITVLVCQGGTPAEFVAQIPYFPEMEDAKQFNEEACIAYLNESVGTKLSDIRIISIKNWKVSTEIASSFIDKESCRLIVAGDAAHIVAPAGGQGMNMGIADSYNIAWRLGQIFYRRLINDNSETSKNLVQHFVTAELTKDERNHILQYNRERKAVAEYTRDVCLTEVERGSHFAKTLNYNHDLLHKLMSVLPSLGPVTSSLVREAFTAAKSTMKHMYSTPKMMESIRKAASDSLASGNALGLAFPGSDLAYSYTDAEGLIRSSSHRVYDPQRMIGCRIPHCSLYSMYGGKVYKLSTVDISSFLQPAIHYCFLVFSQKTADLMCKIIAEINSVKKTLAYVCHWKVDILVGDDDMDHIVVNDQPLLLGNGEINRIGVETAATCKDVEADNVPTKTPNFFFSTLGKNEESNQMETMIHRMRKALELNHGVVHKSVFTSSSHLQRFSNMLFKRDVDVSDAVVIVRPDGHIADIQESIGEDNQTYKLYLREFLLY